MKIISFKILIFDLFREHTLQCGQEVYVVKVSDQAEQEYKQLRSHTNIHIHLLTQEH